MSRLPFELLLALRYLRPKRSFVSVVTLISVLGVALGVAVLIVVISVFTGFEHKLREKILGFNPHLRIIEDHRTMRDYGAIARSVAENPQVKAVAPFVLGQVLIETEGREGRTQTAAPWLRGLDPGLEPQISVLPQSVQQGRFDVSGQGLLVGCELARDLRVKVGDRLQVYSPRDLIEWRESANEGKRTKEPEPAEYEVRGVFDVGYFEYNRILTMASLANAQKMYQLDQSVHGLLVALRDPFRAVAVQGELERALGPGYQISNWMDENAGLLGQVMVAKKIQFYLLFFILIVAALCILSALITFVVQKTREIGMLKALGASDFQVTTVFVCQSGLIGGVGIGAGVGLGRLLLGFRNEFLHFMSRVLHAELLAPSIYGFGDLPALITPADVLLISGSALALCLLGGFVPAWLAGRLKPVEAMRHE